MRYHIKQTYKFCTALESVRLKLLWFGLAGISEVNGVTAKPLVLAVKAFSAVECLGAVKQKVKATEHRLVLRQSRRQAQTRKRLL